MGERVARGTKYEVIRDQRGRGNNRTIDETAERKVNLPQKWAIELSVEGDLRFLSHHDMMRAIERLLRRAGLPLRYSQGFNPRPALSLVLPRPVGVASEADLLVVTLEEDLAEDAVLRGFNDAAPIGLRATSAHKIEKSNPLPRVPGTNLSCRPRNRPTCVSASTTSVRKIHGW